ncbi:MAG: C39 family peptidase [Oscillospiraceae bacterium]|nr:C39 family peptidase [Oscillospiraceae bacterium]
MEFKIKHIISALLAAIMISVPAGLMIRDGTAEVSGETTASDSEQRTAIVSQAARPYKDDAVYIDIRTIFQLPELPTGCEATALTMALNFYGFNADKTDIAKNYLPQSAFMQLKDDKVYINNFNNIFFGDPFGRGWGCFSNAIVYTAQSYIAQNSELVGLDRGDFRVRNISGSSPEELYEYLKAGVPVICWGTLEMAEPVYNFTYYDILTGEPLVWYSKEHCFVLTGFDNSDSTVIINDPQFGVVSHDKELFELRYSQMRSQAVIIEKRPERPVRPERPEREERPGTTTARTSATAAERTSERASERTSDSSNPESQEHSDITTALIAETSASESVSSVPVNAR